MTARTRTVLFLVVTASLALPALVGLVLAYAGEAAPAAQLGPIDWLLVHGWGLLGIVASATLAWLARHIAGQAWIQRALLEVGAAAAETRQVYVDEIRRASADGSLTDEERAEAKRRALAIARANIGAKGLARLARIIGVPDVTGWLANKVEAAVAHMPKPSPILAMGAPLAPTEASAPAAPAPAEPAKGGAPLGALPPPSAAR